MPPGGEVNISPEAATSVSEKYDGRGSVLILEAAVCRNKEVTMKAMKAMKATTTTTQTTAMPFAADGVIFTAEEVDRRNREALSAVRRGSIMWLLSAGRSSEYSARREYLDDVYSDVVLKINDEWLDNHQKHSWLWWADFIAAITGCAVAEEERRFFRRYLFEAGMVRMHGFFRLSPRSSRIRDARWNE